MDCSMCGAHVAPGDRACPECGMPVAGAAAQTQDSRAAAPARPRKRAAVVAAWVFVIIFGTLGTALWGSVLILGMAYTGSLIFLPIASLLVSMMMLASGIMFFASGRGCNLAIASGMLDVFLTFLVGANYGKGYRTYLAFWDLILLIASAVFITVFLVRVMGRAIIVRYAPGETKKLAELRTVMEYWHAKRAAKLSDGAAGDGQAEPRPVPQPAVEAPARPTKTKADTMFGVVAIIFGGLGVLLWGLSLVFRIAYTEQNMEIMPAAGLCPAAILLAGGIRACTAGRGYGLVFVSGLGNVWFAFVTSAFYLAGAGDTLLGFFDPLLLSASAAFALKFARKRVTFVRSVRR